MFGIALFQMRALQFVLFCFAAFAAYATYKNRVLSYIAVFLAAAWLLVLKGYEYIPSGRLPMDLSAISYFLYGTCVILPFRPAKVTASQLATLCGLVYGLCVIVRPESFYSRDPDEFVRYFAMVNHAMLFFGGLAMMGHVRFKWTDIFWTLGIVAAVVIYTEICVACGVAEGNAIFSQILNGSIIREVLPNFSMPWWYYIAYYAALLTAVAAWLGLTYVINRKATSKDLKARFFTY